MLNNEMVRQGGWLFRWRSYLPLVLVPVFLLALWSRGLIRQATGCYSVVPWGLLALAIAFAGLFIRCLVVGYSPPGTSGRETGPMQADTLTTDGLYSLVRNPLYLGNFLMLLGIAVSTEVWWAELISVLAFWLYYERIILAEEDFLLGRYGEAYSEWTDEVPVFLPRLKGWRKPDRPFETKKVLRKEFAGMMVIVGSITVLKAAGGFFAGQGFNPGAGWSAFFIAGLALYLTLYYIKKRTDLLR
jgi:protein-S-isoprenylcysteine O-methyltransferase Ste14